MLFGVGLALFFSEPKDLLEFSAVLFSSLFGSTVPDWDLKLTHRSLLHNTFVPLLTSSILYIAMLITNTSFSFTIASSYLISYFSHILLDLLTGGVVLFYPICDKTFYIMKRRYDDQATNTLAEAAGLALVLAKTRLH